VDEFDDGRHRIAAFSTVAAQFRGGQQQQRSETFAAAADQVVDDLRDETDLRTEIHLHLFLDPFEVVLIVLKYVLYLHGFPPRLRDPISRLCRL